MSRKSHTGSVNEITGDRQRTKCPSEAFLRNYDAIFRKKEVAVGSHECPKCGTKRAVTPHPCVDCGHSYL